jgi:hypothetical protein
MSDMRKLSSPVLPPMATTMGVDFLFNEDGAWLLHDKPLIEDLSWIEYDADTETATLVTEQGRLQDLGLKVPLTRANWLLQATCVTRHLIKDSKIVNSSIVPIIVRAFAV